METDSRKPLTFVVVCSLCYGLVYVLRNTEGFVHKFIILLCIIAMAGLAEGFFLSRFFALNRRKSLCLMALANYPSLFVAGCLIPLFERLLGPQNIYNAVRSDVLLVLGLYTATVVVEWPFVAALYPKGTNRAWRSLPANLAAQGFTLAWVMACAFCGGDYELLLSAKKSPPASFAKDPDAVIVYRSYDDKSVYRQRLDGQGREKLCEFPYPQFGPCCNLRKSGADSYRMVAALPEKTELVLMEDYPREATPDPPSSDESIRLHSYFGIDLRRSENHYRFYRPSRFSAFLAGRDTYDEIVLGDASSILSVIHIYAHAWLSVFTRGSSAEDAPRGHFAMYWTRQSFPVDPDYVTLLPGDQVVFQWGNQICLLDCKSRTLGLIAEGYSPVVVPKKEWMNARATSVASHPG